MEILILKITITEIKNSLYGPDSRMEIIKKRVNEFEDRPTEIIVFKEKEKIGEGGNEQSL